MALLTAIHADDAPRWLRELPAVEILRHGWLQNYVPTSLDTVRWRITEDGLPPSAIFISSPYDTDAHYAIKRTTAWVGYKVHLTETCDESDETHHLITHVETTAGPRLMALLRQESMRPCTNKAYCQPTISSIRDFWMPNCW